jgi:hypothetical protein
MVQIFETQLIDGGGDDPHLSDKRLLKDEPVRVIKKPQVVL